MKPAIKINSGALKKIKKALQKDNDAQTWYKHSFITLLQ